MSLGQHIIEFSAYYLISELFYGLIINIYIYMDWGSSYIDYDFNR